MKRLMAIFCLAIYANAASWQLLTIVCFYANQSQIIQTLCENRMRPERGCAGHCVLKRKLRTDAMAQGASVEWSFLRLAEHVETQLEDRPTLVPKQEAWPATPDPALGEGHTRQLWAPPKGRGGWRKCA